MKIRHFCLFCAIPAISNLIGMLLFTFISTSTVFLTQIIPRQQKNADAKVALSISCQQKMEFASAIYKKAIFPNIQLNSVVNRLPPFKNLSDHASRFLME